MANKHISKTHLKKSLKVKIFIANTIQHAQNTQNKQSKNTEQGREASKESIEF